MSDIVIHRKLSILNGKGLIFLHVDGENQGAIHQILQNNRTISSGKHSICVKDILGFTSNTLELDVLENERVEITVGSRSYLILGILLLAIFSFFLKEAFYASNAVVVSIILAILWGAYLIALIGFWRHKLYYIRLEREAKLLKNRNNMER